jgi:hypothetical protein
MPQPMRSMVDDARRSATIIVKFEDGVELDSCRAVLPSELANFFELAPGETLPVNARSLTPSAPSTLQPDSAPPKAVPSTPAVASTTSVSVANEAAIPAPTATISVTAGPVTSVPISTAVSTAALTQPTNMLSDDEVKLAVAGKGRKHWVSIQDESLMAPQGNQVPEITLFLPEAVLAIRSESAKKQFIQYEPTEEDKRRSLMVVAKGYAGKTIGEGCTSITRVILLSDPSGGIVKEAYLSEPLDEVWSNSFGATNDCQELVAKFALEDVLRVKAAAPKGEFFVAAFSGTVNTKMYKIKKKHQSKLGLE